MENSLKLRIVDYFDSLINQVDLKAESLLISNESSADYINQKRELFIKEIKKVEYINLENLNNVKIEELSSKDEIEINEMIFKEFCFIVSNKNIGKCNCETSKIDKAFGYLLIIDKYLTKKNIICYQELVKVYGPNMNLFFKVKDKRKNEYYTSSLRITSESHFENVFVIRTIWKKLLEFDKVTISNIEIEEFNEEECIDFFQHTKILQLKYSKKVDNIVSIINNFKKFGCQYISLELQTYNYNYKSFSHFDNIQELTLKYIYFEHLDLGQFYGLSHLINLNAEKIGIGYLDSATFCGTTNLKKIDFIKSEIASMSMDVFDGMTSLEYLNWSIHLANNPKRSPLTFKDCTSLRQLKIEGSNMIVSFKAIRDMSHLHTLHLLNCEIDSLDSLSFSNLENLKEVRMTKNGIKRLYSSLFVKSQLLEKMTISNNNVNEIEPDAFKGLSNITEFDLSGNEIRSIDSSIFKYCSKLTKVCLSHNQISSFDRKAFSTLINLQELNISFNQIDTFDQGKFQDMANLTHLNLSRNNLRHFLSKTFKCLASPKTDSAEMNTISIAHIDSSLFEGLVNLKNLNLSYNMVDTFESGTFIKLQNLEVLNVSSMNIKHVDTSFLSGLVNLNNLDMSSNSIESIDATLFKETKKLKYLNLGDNYLRNINTSAFAGLSSLHTLNLANNKIKSIDQSLFADLSALEYLDLDGNELSSLSNFAFQNSKNLRELSFEVENWTVIDPTQIFDGLDRLRVLKIVCKIKQGALQKSDFVCLKEEVNLRIH